MTQLNSTLPRSPARRALLALAALILTGAGLPFGADSAQAATRRELEADGSAALARLYALNPKARELARKSVAIMIFPKITKVGVLVVGGQRGDGVLYSHGKPIGYFRIRSGSVGWQAGGQTLSYAMFFFTDSGLGYLRKSKGWSIGSGPSVVIIDKGKAGAMNTTTLQADVAAIPFGQEGLMAGLGLEGTKISQISPDL